MRSFSAGARSAARNRGDTGFTLVELVVVCAILPLVIAAIVAAFIEVLSLQGGFSKNISDSSDAQTVSATFQLDVQSAATLTTESSPVACGTGTQLLGLEWTPTPSATYQTVVSYVEVPNNTTPPTYSLVRNYCTSGTNATPTNSLPVSADIPTGPLFSVAAPTGVIPANGWVYTQGITGVTFSVTEPGSAYAYTLAAEPLLTTGSQPTTIPPANSTCGFSTPGTGTYASTLCLVGFSAWNTQTAATGVNCTAANAPQEVTPPAGSLPMSTAIAGTPFTITFCLSVSSTNSNGSPAQGAKAAGYNDIKAVALPTYANPPASEAYLGDNGFYTGIPGDPALYTCQSTPCAVPPAASDSADGSVATLDFTNIQVLNASGTPASGWELITGDAESTDYDEANTWTTCPTISVSTSSGIPYYPNSGSGCQGTGLGPGSATNDPDLNLLPNSATSPYGNACATTTTGVVDLSGAPPAPGQTAAPSSLAGPSPTVECAATMDSDKTGTVMLESLTPTSLMVRLDCGANQGNGLQAVFLGVLLP